MASLTQDQGQREVLQHQSAQGQPHQAQNGQRPLSAQPAPTEYCSFLSGYNETKRYTVLNLIGKGSYGVVCAAKDNITGELVAIKKIQNVFDNVADARRILREITLLRVLKHPDIVEIKHIVLPADPNTFKDLYVVFEFMESDLHTVIGVNDDLTRDHHKVFLYQLLRGLNFMHANSVLHRDLKPKNILANSNCKLKICDFGLARPIMGNLTALTPVLWTDYVATRWYRAPELCGCFYDRYTSAVDMWSIGCIFAEVLLGKPLFPGRDAVSQLQLVTDLLGKPPPAVVDTITNPRARKFLQSLPHKEPRPLASKFPNADPQAVDLLGRMLAFDPSDRPSAAEALSHPYFTGLPEVRQELVPVAENFAFENCARLSELDVRHLIYLEALHYHPHVRKAYEAQIAAMCSGGQGEGGGGFCVRLPCPTALPYTMPCTPADNVAAQFLKQQNSFSQDSAESTESDVSGAMPAGAAVAAATAAAAQMQSYVGAPPPHSVGGQPGVMAGPSTSAAVHMWRYPAIPPPQQQMQPQPMLQPYHPADMHSQQQHPHQPVIPAAYGEVGVGMHHHHSHHHQNRPQAPVMMATPMPAQPAASYADMHYYGPHGRSGAGGYHTSAPSQQQVQQQQHYHQNMYHRAQQAQLQQQMLQQQPQRTTPTYASGPSYGSSVGPPFRPQYPY